MMNECSDRAGNGVSKLSCHINLVTVYVAASGHQQ